MIFDHRHLPLLKLAVSKDVGQSLVRAGDAATNMAGHPSTPPTAHHLSQVLAK